MICITKYENDIFSLNETSNGFIHAFCLSKIHFHKPGSFKLIKNAEIFSRFVKFISNEIIIQGYHAFKNGIAFDKT